ncbi:MAG: UDP-2,3-diacylglucosamine diphosphatase [Bacteroidales bacterium]|jgi:UDP-2,3-diacylglucosamine hydrolase|nr:UDP-2,3-diacylglucosamine diphosphatase [Bacteroidales bacterium]
MELSRKKIYFASDFHLGNSTRKNNLRKEKLVVRWLNAISKDAEEIYLLGDVFDFWFEYKNVVPKGFVRFLGTLAHLADSGIRIHLFCGNHDLWIRDYFQEELGIIVHKQNEILTLKGKTFMLGHGDGLDPKDKKYKFINTIFKNKFCISAFASLHPRWAIAIAQKWSKSSRASHSETDKIDLEEKEPIYKFCLKTIETQKIDYFVFGHRHLVCSKKIKDKTYYMNLGYWNIYGHYAVWDGRKLIIKKFD